MVVRKSWAWGASGEKLSRVMVPLRGSIQSGRFAWSGFSGREEKSLYPKLGSCFCTALSFLWLNVSSENLSTTSSTANQSVLCRGTNFQKTTATFQAVILRIRLILRVFITTVDVRDIRNGSRAFRRSTGPTT
ncbi:hypothetical protein BJX96DRAFT_47466 [Aspergillus floccosus]